MSSVAAFSASSSFFPARPLSMSLPAGRSVALESALFPSPSEVALSVPSNQMLMVNFEGEEDIEAPRKRQEEVCELEEEVSRIMNSEPRRSVAAGAECSSFGGMIPTGDPFAYRDWISLDKPKCESDQADEEDLSQFAFDIEH